MRRAIELPGQEPLIRQITDLLKAGRSVLLFGPEGIGKSAIIAAVARDGLIVVDPLEHVSPQRAFRMRRALDHGVVHVAASRVARGRELGSVGRIMWRFSTVRVRELRDSIIRRIVISEVGATDRAGVEPDSGWIREMIALAKGRPGFATAMGRFAAEWRRQHGYLPMPALAFAATRADATIRRLQPAAQTAGRRTDRR
jgi:hypothetical protein